MSGGAGVGLEGVQDEEEAGDGAGDGAGGRRKGRQRVILSQAVEEQLVEWVRENQHFYNKGNAKWKNYKLKNGEWDQKAINLNINEITGTHLQCWFQSMRNR